jgi:hypothetical protein
LTEGLTFKTIGQLKHSPFQKAQPEEEEDIDHMEEYRQFIQKTQKEKQFMSLRIQELEQALSKSQTSEQQELTELKKQV